MRPSLHQHNLARLRDELGSVQRAFAEDVDCPLMVLQNIEAGRTKLREDVALKIATATGVSVGWLLGNDPNAPVIAADGQPYTKRHYKVAQARKRLPVGLGYPRAWDARAHYLALCGRLAAVLEGVPFINGERAEVIFWQAEQLVLELEKHGRIAFGFAYRGDDAAEMVAAGVTHGQVETGIRAMEHAIRQYRDPEARARHARLKKDAESLASAPDLPEQVAAMEKDPTLRPKPQSSRPRRPKSA